LKSSKLAQQKAAAAPVKSFASQMEKDHMKTTTEHEGLVSGGKVKAPLPTAMDDVHKSKLDKLKGLSGADFGLFFVGGVTDLLGCAGRSLSWCSTLYQLVGPSLVLWVCRLGWCFEPSGPSSRQSTGR
jgi:hypothetical protein